MSSNVPEWSLILNPGPFSVAGHEQPLRPGARGRSVASVNDGEVCPSRSATVRGSTPGAIKNVA